jgi:hypothetical protein
MAPSEMRFMITLSSMIAPNIIGMSRKKLHKLYNAFSRSFESKITLSILRRVLNFNGANPNNLEMYYKALTACIIPTQPVASCFVVLLACCKTTSLRQQMKTVV